MNGLRRFLAGFLISAFVTVSVCPLSIAQSLSLPAPNEMVTLSNAVRPVVLKGIKIDPKSPFQFDMLLDKGDSALPDSAMGDEADQLVRYFLASLTIPEKDLWVNLSPLESDRIIDDTFGRTAMGRDLLADDYLLKQITSSLLHPDGEIGKQFWAEVYRQAHEQFGTSDVPVEMINKVWIVPGKAVIYENVDARGNVSAVLDEAHLKVMLESDYLAMKNEREGQTGEALVARDSLSKLSRQIVREIVIPRLEKEVNEGKNFTRLRQVYHSLLLAVWLKKKIRDAEVKVQPDETSSVRGNLLNHLFVDKRKTGGNELPNSSEEIQDVYGRYVEAFKTGVYNLIREEVDFYSDEMIPRRYFSGGVEMKDAAQVIETRKPTTGWFRKTAALAAVVFSLTLAPEIGGAATPKLPPASQPRAGGAAAITPDSLLDEMAQRIAINHERKSTRLDARVAELKAQFKSSFQKHRIDLNQLIADANSLYKREPALRIFGDERGFLIFVMAIAFNESSIGSVPGEDMFQVLQPTYEWLARTHPELRGLGKGHYRVAFQNIVRLANIARFFYPHATDEEYRLMIAGTFNFGHRGFTQNVEGVPITCHILQAIYSGRAVKNDPRAYDHLTATENLLVAIARMAWYALKEERIFAGPIDQQNLSPEQLLKKMGYYPAPKGWQVVMARDGNDTIEQVARNFRVTVAQVISPDALPGEKAPDGARYIVPEKHTIAFTTDSVGDVRAYVAARYKNQIKGDKRKLDQFVRNFQAINRGSSRVHVPTYEEIENPHLPTPPMTGIATARGEQWAKNLRDRVIETEVSVALAPVETSVEASVAPTANAATFVSPSARQPFILRGQSEGDFIRGNNVPQITTMPRAPHLVPVSVPARAGDAIQFVLGGDNSGLTYQKMNDMIREAIDYVTARHPRGRAVVTGTSFVRDLARTPDPKTNEHASKSKVSTHRGDVNPDTGIFTTAADFKIRPLRTGNAEDIATANDFLAFFRSKMGKSDVLLVLRENQQSGTIWHVSIAGRYSPSEIRSIANASRSMPQTVALTNAVKSVVQAVKGPSAQQPNLIINFLKLTDARTQQIYLLNGQLNAFGQHIHKLSAHQDVVDQMETFQVVAWYWMKQGFDQKKYPEAVKIIRRLQKEWEMAGYKNIPPLPDAAQATDAVQNRDLGGIDLAGADLEMLITGKTGSLNVDFSPEQLKLLEQNVSGFNPVIINLHPMESLPLFFGFDDRSPDSARLG